ncbi:MAG: hypothetical protein ABI844_11205 [Saprospiraceae bacterium]
MRFYTLLLATYIMANAHTALSQTAELTPPLADSLYFKSEWVEAIPIYEKVVQAGKKNSLLFYRLAYSLQQVSSQDKALKNYYLSMEQGQNPNLSRVTYVNLAKIYSSKNNMDSSLVCLHRAMVMGYANLNDLETAPEFTSFRSAPAYDSVHQKVLQATFPCIAQAESRWFDFWVGDWIAYVTGTKNQAGISKIEKIAGACAILENWTSSGNTFNGKSINFYNNQSKKWEQHWVGSAGGYQKFENGEYKDRAMRFTFIRLNANGTNAIGKFTFFNEGPDQVRQLSELSTDEGKTWNVDYDFTYIRITKSEN